MRLAGVLNDLQMMPLRDFHDGIHVRHLAEQMHGDDGLGSRGDRAFEQGGIQSESALIDVDEHGLGAAIADGFGGRHERAGHSDHLITRADAEAEERQPQCIRSVANPMAN